MMHEKIIVREDKSKVKIIVSFLIKGVNNEPVYRTDVYICPPRKRTFFRIFSEDEWAYRRLNMEDREKFIHEKQLEKVTEAELLQAKLEFWEKLKPAPAGSGE